jgi:adenylate kinase
MDKVQKFDYQTKIEDKLQSLEVFEVFQDLLKQLVVSRPEKPLDFLIMKLQQNPGKIPHKKSF